MSWFSPLAQLVFVAVVWSAPVLGDQSGEVTLSTSDDPRPVRIPARSRTADPMIVLEGGTLIDGTGSAPVTNARLVIQGDRIVSVGAKRDVAMPTIEYQTIDVSGFYIVPGFIDLHIHLAQHWKADDPNYADSDSAATIRGAKKLAALLNGGVTSIRDVGTRNDVAFKLKEAVERKILEGPRVYWAGKGILARGGHGDETRSGVSESTLGAEHAGGPYARIANGADDWRLAVREHIRAHVDLIKLYAPFTRDEVGAAIEEAHMQGFRVAVDAFEKYIIWAVDAGADTIEHTLATPDPALAMMARNGTALVPTLATYHALVSGGYSSAGLPPGGYYYDLHRSFEMTHEENLNVVRKAHQRGVKIGIGTDMAFNGEAYYPEVYFTEIGFLKDAGLDNNELLESATRIGAEILGMQNKLGTLEKGKLADIVVIRGNPLTDINNLKNIEMVIADGTVVRDQIAD
jgi:imidazolonepropionase-like amidohydrolase